MLLLHFSSKTAWTLRRWRRHGCISVINRAQLVEQATKFAECVDSPQQSAQGSKLIKIEACGAGSNVHGPRRPVLERVDIHRLLHQIQLCALALLASLSCLAELPSGGNTAFARARLSAEEQETIDLFKQNTPSVVFITNLASRRDTFTVNQLSVPQGAGSGFVWDRDGHVVTNYHVIKGALDLQVTMTGGQEFKAKVIGFDEDKDVAVLQIQVADEEKEMLQPMAVGSSSDLLVGQRVFAIGNPFGLDHTLTTGVISGTGREITSGNTGRPIQDVIQTDAAINPGNSGGPLIDSGGDLIGVNTAIYSASGANSGVGFAIPVDAVRGSVEQIITSGKVMHPVIGISFAPDQASEELGVTGILVLEARQGGPAWKAGIQGTKRDNYGRLVYGDIITKFNGASVKNMSDLYKNLDKCSIGDEIDVEVLRQQDMEHVRILLGPNA